MTDENNAAAGEAASNSLLLQEAAMGVNEAVNRFNV
jgi:methyl-accepting chemotaxis protein